MRCGVDRTEKDFMKICKSIEYYDSEYGWTNIKRYQFTLKYIGLYNGRIDGICGNDTAHGIYLYAKSINALTKHTSYIKYDMMTGLSNDIDNPY